MGRLRRVLLTALPKVALSRSTRLLAHLPIPGGLRGPLYGAYARRYGAVLDEMRGEPRDYANFASFFQRTLRDSARPIAADAAFVWPADGRVVTAGALDGDRLPQIKGVDYALADLIVDAELGERLRGGSQGTVYLSPGDYHRVHAPFAGEVLRTRHVPGGLFPVNPGAVRSIPGLFARNERLVLEMRLVDGRAAAVVLVAALNVSDTVLTCAVPGHIDKGAELGAFGLGSTVVAVAGPGEPAFGSHPPETVVRMGQSAL